MILLINHFFNRVCKKVAGLKPAEKWVCEWKKTLYHLKWTLRALQHVSFIPQINTQIQNVIIFLKRLLNKLIVLLHFFSCDDLLTWNDMKYVTETVVDEYFLHRSSVFQQTNVYPKNFSFSTAIFYALSPTDFKRKMCKFHYKSLPLPHWDTFLFLSSY